jgi:Zn-dependent peptidase ImmA (M78 family)
MAGNRAERLLDELGKNVLPIDPFVIAEDHEIMVKSKEFDTAGVSGCLLKVDDSFGIMYATHIKNEGFIRFTVAHELGHYFLPGHVDTLFINRKLHYSQSNFVSADPFELEADHFAASLLMPSRLFLRETRRAGEGFGAINSLAETFKTSITATGIRFATYAEDPVAIIISKNDRIHYCFMSEAIKELKGIGWIKKGDLIPKSSKTYDFNSDINNITSSRVAESITTLDDWFENAPAVEMNEDVIGLGSYGKTLTVLFTNEALENEDEDEYEWL